MLNRIRAAIAAFKDPSLIGEARGMRNSLEGFGHLNQFALLRAEYIGGTIYPRVEMLTYSQRENIRQIIGHF